MRYWLAPLVLLTACTANPSVAGKPACAAASPEVRRAIEQQIDDAETGAIAEPLEIRFDAGHSTDGIRSPVYASRGMNCLAGPPRWRRRRRREPRRPLIGPPLLLLDSLGETVVGFSPN